MFNILRSSRVIFIALLIMGGVKPACAAESIKIPNDLAIWNPNAVTWSVDANSTTDDICQIHWIYDDEIDVYVKQNKDNLYYFGIDYLGSNKKLKNLFESGAFKAILVVNNDQIDLGSQRLDSNKIIAIAPTAINSIEVLKQSEALFLKSSDALYSFPLENTIENFTVYRQCLKDNGQYVDRDRIVEAQPLTAESSTEPVSEMSAAPMLFPSGEELNNAVAESASVPKVVTAPPSANGVDLLFGNNVSSSTQDVIEPTEGAGGEPAMALEISAPDDARSSINQQRVSQQSPIEQDQPVSMLVEEQETPSIEPAQKQQEKTNDEALEVAESAEKEDLPKDLSVPPKGYLKGPDGFLGEGLEYADGVGKNNNGQGGDSSKSDKENSCSDKGQVNENITGVIQNLTRKLTLLEKEKEALRTKLIAGAGTGDSSVLSEILACKTEGAEEVPLMETDYGLTEKYEVLIDGMKAELENLRAENDLLNAAVVDKPSIGNINEVPKTAVLNDKINKLEIENIQLKREVSEFKKMIGTAASAEKEPSFTEKEVSKDISKDVSKDVVAPLQVDEPVILQDIEPIVPQDGGVISREGEEIIDWGDMEKEILDSGDASP